MKNRFENNGATNGDKTVNQYTDSLRAPDYFYIHCILISLCKNDQLKAISFQGFIILC